MRTVTPLRALLLALALVTAGCESATAPNEPTWTLSVPLTGLEVIGDCEARRGNPGEFAWQIAIGDTSGAFLDVRETGAFPSAGGAWELSEDRRTYALPYSLRLNDIPSDRRRQFHITAWAVEWDGAERDGNMTNEHATFPIPNVPSGTASISVGPSSACRLTFGYEWRWTEG